MIVYAINTLQLYCVYISYSYCMAGQDGPGAEVSRRFLSENSSDELMLSNYHVTDVKGQTKLTFTWHTPNRVNIK